MDRHRWHHAQELGITAQDLPKATRAAALVTHTRVELLCEALDPEAARTAFTRRLQELSRTPTTAARPGACPRQDPHTR